MSPPNRHPKMTPEDFKIAIICALPREFDAVEALFDAPYSHLCTDNPPRNPNFVRMGRLGTFDIVLACQEKMGKVTAASVASSLCSIFPCIDLILLVGICGGVPFPTDDTELILGDVIISHRVVEFDFGRQYPDRFEQKGHELDTLNRSHREIRSLISAGLQTRETRLQFQEMHGRYLQSLQDKSTDWRYPGVDQDRLFPSSYLHVDPPDGQSNNDCESVGCSGNIVQRKRLSSDDRPQTLFHFGALASGDTVMKSGEHRDKLTRKANIIGFEMEGAGVCASASCLIVKGVCDYADSHKNKIWQDYAAASAASCAKALLDCLAQLNYTCGSFLYYESLQTENGNATSCIIGQTSRQWKQPSLPSETCDLDQHRQSQNEALHRLEDQISNPVMRHALTSAARDTLQNDTCKVMDIQRNRSFQSKPRQTFFGSIVIQTHVVERQRVVAGETMSQTETRTSFIFHPAPWLVRLGLRYGLKAMAINHHRSWQYSILPVHARPDDSPIFLLSADGNVDAVRLLFKTGQASVFDTDTNGLSPLHYATRNSQFEMAKFLILEGADKKAHAYTTPPCWDSAYTPASFIPQSSLSGKPLDLLSLFRDCIDFSEPTADGWILFTVFDGSTQRAQNTTPNLVHDWFTFLIHMYREEGTSLVQVRDLWRALYSVGRRKEVGNVKMLLDIDPQGQGYANLSADPSRRSHFFLFLAGAHLVLQLMIDRGFEFQDLFNGESPASVSMRFLDTFFDWRADVTLIHPDCECLIEQETSKGCASSLRGWSFDTLRSLCLLKPTVKLVNEYAFGAMIENTVYCRGCCMETWPWSIDEDHCIMEPWWELVKHSIKTNKCLCDMVDWVHDGRDPSTIQHAIACRQDEHTSQVGSNTDDDSLEDPDDGRNGSDVQTKLIRDYNDPCYQEDTGSQAGSENDYHSVDGTDDGQDSSGISPSMVSCHSDSDYFPESLRSLAEYLYIDSGGWRNQYHPAERYCLNCLSSLEGWGFHVKYSCEHEPKDSMSENSDPDYSD